jgi:hypothetical protein
MLLETDHPRFPQVYDLPQGPKAYDERIDNMTFMLQRLLEERRMGSPTVQGDALCRREARTIGIRW